MKDSVLRFTCLQETSIIVVKHNVRDHVAYINDITFCGCEYTTLIVLIIFNLREPIVDIKYSGFDSVASPQGAAYHCAVAAQPQRGK
jgi:hypothetical protein